MREFSPAPLIPGKKTVEKNSLFESIWQRRANTSVQGAEKGFRQNKNIGKERESKS
jgi:hypothetical protein